MPSDITDMSAENWQSDGGREMLFELAVLLFVVSSASGKPEYAGQLPNGDKVPNPCGGLWRAVGHYTMSGGPGNGNSLGWQFVGAGRVWKTVCPVDHDGDGMTTGEELGDPDCVWTSGAAPAKAPKGNPVVCEPVDSANCRVFNRRIWATNPSQLPCFSGQSSLASPAWITFIAAISALVLCNWVTYP